MKSVGPLISDWLVLYIFNQTILAQKLELMVYLKMDKHLRLKIKFKNLKIEKRENYNVIIGSFNIFDYKKNYEKKLNPEIRVYNLSLIHI